jgi:predicted ATPase/DNA-binding CsgD family transcriptional regulator
MAESRLLNDAGVSAREAEVLALVGAHLTNMEIAGRLFISVRTVESHVSSLLRKLEVTDRRALAELAARLEVARGHPALRMATASLPSPLTSFVGRAAERAALAEALTRHRLVTAVGPGGVGKTRLAVAVAADVTHRFSGGAWYVDLVPVTDPSMVGAAVAGAFGFGEQLGRTPTDTVVSKLAGAEALVVLDNCEHVVGGVAAFIERLLSDCPNTTVLATSRIRLLVPFESVFPVPGLALDPATGEGDATELFVERAAMAGWSSPYPQDRRRIAAICAELNGIALAIELAAARLTTLGLDGLEAGLADQLGLLAGGPRLDDRHTSVRSALDWSFGLLDERDRVVLRRAAVFAAPFTSGAAATVTGVAPIMSGEVMGALARLADHNLLVVVPAPGGTRYRMLETIRQYGAERMVEVGEDPMVRGRHLRWCRSIAELLAGEGGTVPGFDDVADDLRAGLGWAASQPQLGVDAHELAVRLAELTFAAGMPSEAQRRYEEAAALAVDPADAARAFHHGAAVAWGRAAGNEAVRLYRASAEAARRAGDRRRRARHRSRTPPLRTGRHVRTGAARRTTGSVGRGVDAGVR